jgi:hypothetical protein
VIKKYCDRCKKEQERLYPYSNMELCKPCLEEAEKLRIQIEKANEDAWKEFCP